MNRSTLKNLALLIKIKEKCLNIIEQVVQILKQNDNIDNGMFENSLQNIFLIYNIECIIEEFYWFKMRMSNIYWPYGLLCLSTTKVIYVPQSLRKLEINYGKEIQPIFFETGGFHNY
jgi:hypothetical protein